MATEKRYQIISIDDYNNENLHWKVAHPHARKSLDKTEVVISCYDSKDTPELTREEVLQYIGTSDKWKETIDE